jgi:hypothetical protein
LYLFFVFFSRFFSLEEESDNLDVKLEQQKTLKDKLVLEQEKLNQHFETAKVQLELKFAQEKKELEEKVARGELEKNELQRQKEDVEQRMSVSLHEFRVILQIDWPYMLMPLC